MAHRGRPAVCPAPHTPGLAGATFAGNRKTIDCTAAERPRTSDARGESGQPSRGWRGGDSGRAGARVAEALSALSPCSEAAPSTRVYVFSGGYQYRFRVPSERVWVASGV